MGVITGESWFFHDQISDCPHLSDTVAHRSVQTTEDVLYWPLITRAWERRRNSERGDKGARACKVTSLKGGREKCSIDLWTKRSQEALG
jgi:hypothetical protein